MKAKHLKSLRVKIAAGLLVSLIVVLSVTLYVRYASFERFLTTSLQGSGAANTSQIVEEQLAAYLRSRLVISLGSIVAILMIGDWLIGRVVVNRLKALLGQVKRISPGRLDARVRIKGDDEIAELAEAFNRMTQDVQRQTEALSALNTLAVTVSRSLDLDQVLQSALDHVLALMELGAGWITLRDNPDTAIRLAASRGLPESALLAHMQCDWSQCVCSNVFESGRAQVFRVESECPCLAATHLQEEALVFRACVPLKSKGRVLGVMSLAGDAADSAWMFTEDALETLTAIGRQVGVAVENAGLYEELRREEMLRRQLIERTIDLQEQERKRIARELHDQTGQRLTSIILTLGILEETASAPETRARIGDLRDMTAQILKQVRDLALELRPSVLDDLGLLAALRNYFRQFQSRFHLLVDFQVLGLDGRRLPPEVETALFRIAQEALTNVARHAEASGVTVLLEDRGTSIGLIVEDDGKGFDVAYVMNAHPHEHNLGLYGMRERAFLLGGTMTIESTPGRGTTVFVRIPLERGHDDGDGDGDGAQDSLAGG